MLILILGVTGWLVSGLSSARLEINRDKQTTAALAEAKRALIGRAAQDVNLPGSLVCPDVDNNGDADTTAGGGGIVCGTSLSPNTYLGRLPWKTLELDDIRDGDGERLWYALSPRFRDSPNSSDVRPLNSEAVGQITVRHPGGAISHDGQVLVGTGAVAVLIAPGSVLTRQDSAAPQDRSGAAVTNPTNYLDIGNDEDNAEFVTDNLNGFINGTIRDGANPDRIIVNDRILVISHADLFSVVEKRVLKEVENALNEYYNVTTFPGKIFPSPAAFSDATCLALPPVLGCFSNPSADYGGRIPANALPAWDGASILKGDANWFQLNQWRELIYYAAAPACTQPANPSCTAPSPHDIFLTVNQPSGPPVPNQKVVVMVAGKPLPDLTPTPQSRLVKTDPYHYVEGENYSPYDALFERNPITANFNDRPASIP